MSKKPSQIVQVKVRMREDLRRKIEHAAQKNGLTVNAEILRRLDQTFDVTLDKLQGSVATLNSRFEEFLSGQARQAAILAMLRDRREELQRHLTETVEIERREELQRRLTKIEEIERLEGLRLEELQRRYTEAGEKDQGDQS